VPAPALAGARQSRRCPAADLCSCSRWQRGASCWFCPTAVTRRARCACRALPPCTNRGDEVGAVDVAAFVAGVPAADAGRASTSPNALVANTRGGRVPVRHLHRLDCGAQRERGRCHRGRSRTQSRRRSYLVPRDCECTTSTGFARQRRLPFSNSVLETGLVAASAPGGRASGGHRNATSGGARTLAFISGRSPPRGEPRTLAIAASSQGWCWVGCP
jgi:hypothetical protein